jgi:hypothetical protein
MKERDTAKEVQMTPSGFQQDLHEYTKDAAFIFLSREELAEGSAFITT